MENNEIKVYQRQEIKKELLLYNIIDNDYNSEFADKVREVRERFDDLLNYYRERENLYK